MTEPNHMVGHKSDAEQIRIEREQRARIAEDDRRRDAEVAQQLARTRFEIVTSVAPPPKRQKRKAISFAGYVYQEFRQWCRARDVAMSAEATKAILKWMEDIDRCPG